MCYGSQLSVTNIHSNVPKDVKMQNYDFYTYVLFPLVSLFYQNIISAIRLEAAQRFLILKTESQGRMSATGNKCS
jgi:hypothetical protein